MIDEIFSKLTKIILDKNTIKKLNSQGLVGSVYEAESSLGPVIINVVERRLREHDLQNVPEKIEKISNYLRICFKEIIPEVYEIGKLNNGGHFMIQKKLIGLVSGLQQVVGNQVVPIFNVKEVKEFENGIDELFYNLHQLEVSKKFGHLSVVGGKLTAEFNTWKDFLISEGARWLKNLYNFKFLDDVYNEKILTTEKLLKIISNKYEKYFENVEPRFIHGDLNPGNILEIDGKITGLLDFEWSVSGDPIWEFAFANTFPNKRYIELSEINVEILDLKKKIYRFYWLLWGAQVHVYNDDPVLFTWLLDKCIEAGEELI
jgi:hypothetical protein